jgi:hypothetical protein
MIRKAILGALGAAFLAGGLAVATPAEAQRWAPAEGLADPRRGGGWDGPRRGGWDGPRRDWDRRDWGRRDWDRRGPPPWARGYGPPPWARAYGFGPRCRTVIQERYSYRLGGYVRRPVEVCR